MENTWKKGKNNFKNGNGKMVMLKIGKNGKYLKKGKNSFKNGKKKGSNKSGKSFKRSQNGKVKMVWKHGKKF